MGTIDFAVIALGILAFALVSGRLTKSVITPPMAFAVFGFMIGPYGARLAVIDLDTEIIRTLAELTLVLVLFTDAARIDLKHLRRDHSLPIRLLTIGMPLTFILGFAVALTLFPVFGIEIGLIEAALIAIILTPTDAALGQIVVIAERVPVRVRQALNVESGLNDGLVLPLVLIFIALGLSISGQEASQPIEYWVKFIGLQLLLGPLVGVGVGLFGGYIVDRAAQAKWMTLEFQGMSSLGLALVAFAVAELVGGNGFISAFIAGLVMGATKRSLCSYLFEFAETEGQLLALLTFMIFGAVMVPHALIALNGPERWPILIYAGLSLTAIRMFPVVAALFGKGLKPQSILFLGWFGPRGLASILFALMAAQSGVLSNPDLLMAVVVTTVMGSIAAHGLSAAPAVKWYGNVAKAFIVSDPECPERQQIIEHPTRIGRGILARRK